jgi:hypothetical protein
MRLQARTAGVGIDNRGIVSRQAGAISGTLSADVVEHNQHKPDYASINGGQPTPIAGAFFAFVASPALGMILAGFILESVFHNFILSVIGSAACAFGAPFAYLNWVRTRSRTPEQARADEQFRTRYRADAERYERQWYCFQCGELFHTK